MKIADVRAIPLAIPVREGSPASPWVGAIGKQVLVRVRTDEGLVGWGESFAYGAPLAVANVVDEALTALLVGEDPTAIESLTQKMHRALMIWGRRGLGMFALSGVELALWDITGKARGVPAWALLGGSVQPRVRAYASLPRYATPSDVGLAASAVVARGYTAVKLHQVDLESVAVARDAVGERVALMVDTNCPWTVEEAIHIGRQLQRYDLRWLEEPVWPPEDYSGLARVRRALGTPIATGENESTMFGHAAILAAGAADVLQPSVTKVGGLGEMRKIATLATAAGATLVPHSYYYGPGLAATVHFCAATPGVPYIECPPGQLEASILQDPIRCVDGWVTVGDRPGLGADPDPEVLERFPYRSASARPFYLT